MAIEKTLRGVVLGGVFALPFIAFVVSSSLFFPFITGKNFAFRIIVEIITGAYLALALLNPAYRPKRSWLFGAFAAFVVIVALADAFGAYPFKSIWSNFERMDGWMTLAHLFCYFVVASTVLSTEKLWRAFWHVSLAASVLMALYGLLQLAGVASLAEGFESAQRIAARLGNPIYLAAYMLFHIAIAAMLWTRAWHEGRPGKRTGVSLVYGGIIALDTAVLLMTGTRGAMLGLIGGTFLGVLLFAFRAGGRARHLALGALLGIVLLAGGFWLVRDQSWVQHVPFLQRLATISLEDSTTKARFYNWGMAWEGVKERPILGWGQENYAIVFDKYYDPRMYAQEQWFDRVHNIVFDWLVAAGFVGLLSYLSLFGAALWMLWRNARGTFLPLEQSILTGLLAGYFVNNLTVFDNITSYLLFTSILAYIAWRGSDSTRALPFPTLPRALAPAAAICAVLVVWGVAWYVNARAIEGGRTLIYAVQPQQAGILKNLEYFEKAISYGTIGTQEEREQLAQAAIQLAGAQEVPDEIKRRFFEAGAREMERMMQESPLDARFPLFLGILYRTYGNYEKAAELLLRAHELSPRKQTILFELAATEFARGNTGVALDLYREAYELEPEYRDARIFYAATAIRLGNDLLAEEILAPLLESGDAADPRIGAAYVSRGRYDKVSEIWQAHIRANPDDIEARFMLAAVYYEGGNSARAIQVLEEIGKTVPGAKGQADALIQQIRSGTELQ